MAQIGKTIIGHAVLLAFLSVLLHVRVEATDQLEICKKDTWQRSKNNHSWTIPSANCFRKEAVVVIRLDKIYFTCDSFAHGHITISKFPSRRLCRLRNGTCFVFTNSAVGRRPLPFVKDCSDGQYWTFIDDISSLSVEYGQTGTDPGLHQTLQLTYVVYSLVAGSPEIPIGLVFSIVLGCIVLLLLVALILVIRSRKKLMKRQRRSPDIAYSAMNRESVHPNPSSEREVVVNQLYGMSRRDEQSQNGIK